MEELKTFFQARAVNREDEDKEMNFGTAATTAQLVSNVVGTVKAARDLAKDITNHELKEAIGEAYDQLFDLRDRILELDEENRQLKTELAKKAEIDGPLPPFGYFFDKRHPDAPLCPKCYQSKDARIAFMGPLQPWSYGTRRVCRICGHLTWEQEPNPRGGGIPSRNYTPFS